MTAERILALFDDVSEDAREIIGESLELQSAAFLRALGSALTFSPRLATAVVTRALRTASWDRHNIQLVEHLGNDEPWRTIREVLSSAIADHQQRRQEMAEPDRLARLQADRCLRIQNRKETAQ